MKYLSSLMALLIISGFSYSWAEELNICYLSLNNQKEYSEAKKFVEKVELAVGNPTLFNVHEFHVPGGNPVESFKSMISSKVLCHGLVISGHHTGSFYGNEALSDLNVRFLEDLSCQSQTSDWFLGVKSLWLQGCRTLGSNGFRYGLTFRSGMRHM